MDQMELRSNQKILQEILGLIESKKYKNAQIKCDIEEKRMGGGLGLKKNRNIFGLTGSVI